MKLKRNIRAMLYIFCALFLVLCIYLIYTVGAYGTRWFSSPYNSRLTSQKTSVDAGDIQDRNGIVLAYTDSDGERRYNSSRSVRRATAHIVGDYFGQTYGAETFFSQYLLGFDQSMIDRLSQAFNGEQRKGSDIRLTIDAQLCDYIYDVMDYYRGAVVVMNYKTGEILASVSQPIYDPEYMEEYLSGKKELDASAMVNRATMGRYTPGSTFKIVTMIAALKYLPGVTERTFECEGPLVFDKSTGRFLPDVSITPEEDILAQEHAKATPVPTATPDPDETIDLTDISATPGLLDRYSVIRDYGSEYHGELTLAEAFNASCNNTFARLAMEIGPARMERVAKELGIGNDFLFDDLIVYSSSYEKPDTDLNTGWSGVGQYKNLMTPLQMCMITSCIANDGVMMEPKLLRYVISSSELITRSVSPKVYSAPLSAREVSVLKETMISTVADGTGRKAAVKGYDVGGKTGTAEISGDKSVKPHAWFTGFIDSVDHPLAITVVFEKSGTGGSVAAPAAGKILKKAIQLGY